MELPVNPPILPMLAKRVSELPTGGSWMFEPKWDGFRALVFRDGENPQSELMPLVEVVNKLDSKLRETDPLVKSHKESRRLTQQTEFLEITLNCIHT